MPSCCIGDFNNLLAQSKKMGGSRYPNDLIYGFREAVCFGGLREVVMKSYPTHGNTHEEHQHGLKKSLTRFSSLYDTKGSTSKMSVSF